jgi:hypothetical protein
MTLQARKSRLQLLRVVATLGLALAASGGAISVASEPAAAAAMTCSLTQSILLDANTSLEGVAATDPNNAWAVGHRSAKSVHSLVDRWDGEAWSEVRTPDAGGLVAVTATAPTNVWAIGSRGALHWNGMRWARIAIPNFGLNGPQNAVSTSPRDLWIVGTDANDRTFVAHWNGRRWSVRRGARTAYYTDVAASSSRDVWVVGLTGNDRPLLLHWNGQRWRKMHLPYRGRGTPRFDAIDASGPRDVWVAGTAHVDASNKDFGIVQHWDGRRWRAIGAVNGSNPYGTVQTTLVALDALADGRVWVGGYSFDETGRDRAVVGHGDSSGWTPIATPDVAGSAFSIAATTGTSWAVGDTPLEVLPGRAVIAGFACSDS